MSLAANRSRQMKLVALAGANAAVFAALWMGALSQRYTWPGAAIAAAAAGVTLAQLLLLGTCLALHGRIRARHWLVALTVVAGTSAAFCALEIWSQRRRLDTVWELLTYALAHELMQFLSLTAVGFLLLLVIRVLAWPCRRFLGLQVEWADIPEQSAQARQFALAEIFLMTAGVGASCWLGRALVDASLDSTLIHGAILLAAVLLVAVPTTIVSTAAGRWRDWLLMLGWSIAVSLALTPLLAVAHETTNLLDGWVVRWVRLATWSPPTFAMAAGFALAAAFTTRQNWLALSRLGLRWRIAATQPATQPLLPAHVAGLTPPAPRR